MCSASTRKDLPVLGVIVPCYNESEILRDSAMMLANKLDQLIRRNEISSQSFILFVDDGSTDNTWALIEQLAMENPYFRGLRLSRNFGHQNALLAGMMEVRKECNCVITIDADLGLAP